jgi:hypothetical protein
MSKRSISVERGCRVVAALLLCAFIIAAVSDVAAAKTTSPTAWTTQFCKALQSWGKEFDASNAQVESTAAKTAGNIPAAKALVVKGINQDASVTGHAAQVIQRAGVPSVPNGKKLSAVFVSGFKKAQQELLGAVTNANALPTDNPATFIAGLSSVVSKLQVDPITPSFKSAAKLDTAGKLGNALQANPDCKFLTSG